MDVTALVAWALIHFLWQGSIVALAAAVVMRGMASSPASLRYGAGVVALAIMAILPFVTFSRLRSLAHVENRPNLLTAEEVRVEPADAPVESRIAAARTMSDLRPSKDPKKADPATAPTSPAPVPTLAETGLARIRTWGDAMAPTIVQIWLVGVFFFSLRLAAGWLRVRQLVRVGVTEASDVVRQRFEAVAARLRPSRTVKLIESMLVRTPAAVGFFRPVLLWPVSLHTGLTVSQIDVLLAHELAHLKRHDYVVNILQTMLETALFYHPGVWWVSKQVREERELCCDDAALSVTGDARGYAEALVALESWRQNVPALATAASGGNLLARVRRLVLAETPHATSRPRWAALPLAAAAIVGILGSAQKAPARTVAATEALAPEKNHAESRGPVGPAQPGAVRRFEGAAPLDSRVAWAIREAGAKSLSHYWIGYSVAADPGHAFLYVDRMTPVSFGDGSMFTGHLKFNRKTGLKVAGVPLEDVIGPRSPAETIVFLGLGAGANPVIERVHAASAPLPVHFEGRPVFWLDQATDAESIGWIRRNFDRAAGDPLREDLVSVVGAHTDAPLVFAAMRDWIDSASGESVRVAAVEALGSIPLKDAVSLLDKTARGDRSKNVRREAAESLGEQPMPEATRLLGALARSTADLGVAEEAAESLGERPDEAAMDELAGLVWSGVSPNVGREAVEAIGESKSTRSIAELEKIARTHSSEDLRREAVETLGDLEEPDRTVPILEALAKGDSSSQVREEAIETLGDIGGERASRVLSELAGSKGESQTRRRAIEALFEQGQEDKALAATEALIKSDDPRAARLGIEILGDVDSSRAVSLLGGLARTGARPDVQRAAVEALSSAAPVDEAFKILQEVASSSAREDVQRKAVEAMGDIESEEAAKELDRIARTHASEQVRVTAVEALDPEHHPGGRALLEKLAVEAGSEAVQAAAIESYADHAEGPEEAAWLAKRVETSPSRKVQMAAIDALEELEEKGIDALITILRTSKDREMRRRALEILSESSDPRAKKELVRILEK